MKTTELQIFDWIKINHNQKKVKVKAVYENLIEPTSVSPLMGDEVSPIPLTPEILGQNGFIHVYTESIVSKYYKHIMNEHGSTAINVYFEEDMDVKVLVQIETNLKAVSGVNSIHNCEIEHVHTLQHAFRLCGLSELADNFKIGGMNYEQKTEEKI